MTTGDPADFVALRLKGSSNVLVQNNVVSTIPPGDLVGEIAMFLGGKRTADIVTASKAARIAIFRFSDLEQLNASSPSTAIKLVRLFITASMYKLSEHKDSEEEFTPSIVSQSKFYHMLQAAQDETQGLGDIPQHYIYTLAQHMFLVKVPKDSLILQKGNKGRGFMFVLEGAVESRADGLNSRILDWRKRARFAGKGRSSSPLWNGRNARQTLTRPLKSAGPSCTARSWKSSTKSIWPSSRRCTRTSACTS